MVEGRIFSANFAHEFCSRTSVYELTGFASKMYNNTVKEPTALDSNWHESGVIQYVYNFPPKFSCDCRSSMSINLKNYLNVSIHILKFASRISP